MIKTKTKGIVLLLIIYIFHDLGGVDYSYKLSSTCERSSFITFMAMLGTQYAHN